MNFQFFNIFIAIFLSWVIGFENSDATSYSRNWVLNHTQGDNLSEGALLDAAQSDARAIGRKVLGSQQDLLVQRLWNEQDFLLWTE